MNHATERTSLPALLESIHRPLQATARALAAESDADADELCQLGLIRAYEVAKRYDAGRGASLLTFAWKGARFAMVEQLGHSAVQAQSQAPFDDEDEQLADPLVPTPEELAERGRNKHLLEPTLAEALASLPPIERELLERTAIDEQSLAEACRELGLEYHYAYYRLRKACETMRQSLRRANARAAHCARETQPSARVEGSTIDLNC